MEPKWDGWRWQVHMTGLRPEDRPRSVGGRNGKDHSGEVPEVDLALKVAQIPEGTVLDGELVWENTLVGARATKKVMFVVFDVLRYKGGDTMKWPWRARRQILEDMFEETEHLKRSLVSPLDDQVLDEWIRLGMEGAVLKRIDAPYLPGSRRRDGFVKIKPQSTTEATVTWQWAAGSSRSSTTAFSRLARSATPGSGACAPTWSRSDEVGCRHHRRPPDPDRPCRRPPAAAADQRWPVRAGGRHAVGRRRVRPYRAVRGQRLRRCDPRRGCALPRADGGPADAGLPLVALALPRRVEPCRSGPGRSP
jgi:hypothetical protein